MNQMNILKNFILQMEKNIFILTRIKIMELEIFLQKKLNKRKNKQQIQQTFLDLRLQNKLKIKILYN